MLIKIINLSIMHQDTSCEWWDKCCGVCKQLCYYIVLTVYSLILLYMLFFPIFTLVMFGLQISGSFNNIYYFRILCENYLWNPDYNKIKCVWMEGPNYDEPKNMLLIQIFENHFIYYQNVANYLAVFIFLFLVLSVIIQNIYNKVYIYFNKILFFVLFVFFIFSFYSFIPILSQNGIYIIGKNISNIKNNDEYNYVKLYESFSHMSFIFALFGIIISIIGLPISNLPNIFMIIFTHNEIKNENIDEDIKISEVCIKFVNVEYNLFDKFKKESSIVLSNLYIEDNFIPTTFLPFILFFVYKKNETWKFISYFSLSTEDENVLKNTNYLYSISFL